MQDKPALDLEEAFFDTDRLRWKRVFPWIRLGEAIRLSLDPRKVILASLGVAIYIALIALAENLPFFLSGERAIDLIAPLTQSLQHAEVEWSVSRDTLEAFNLVDVHLSSGPELAVSDPIVAQPVLSLLESSSIAGAAEAVTRLLIGLIVWSFFGGAIARIAALQFAGDHPTSVVSSLLFSGRHLLSSVVGPLLPFVLSLFLWLLVATGGAIGAIPAVGGAIAGVFWGLSLLFGFIAVVLLVGMALSWPIMVAGTAVEATDSFDSLSRGFNYLFSRPIYLFMLVAAAVLMGTVLTSIVELFAVLTESVTARFFVTFSTSATAALENGGTFGNAAWMLWTVTVRFAVVAFPVAFFWTATAIVYFLMRLSIDAMPMDRIYIPEGQDEDDLAPLVGIAAADRREQSRAEQQVSEAKTPEAASDSRNGTSDATAD